MRPLIGLLLLAPVFAFAQTAPSADIGASPSVVPYGGSASVSWSSSGAVECSLYDNSGYVIKAGTIEKSGISGNYANGSLTTSSSNTYYYGCSNSAGATGWKSVSVAVCAQGQTVVNGACATPTPAPAATVSISVPVITYGQSAILSWSASDAAECSLYDNAGYIIKAGSVERSGVAGAFNSGSLRVYSSNTFNYGCSNGSGSTGWKSVALTVCREGQTVVDNACADPAPPPTAAITPANQLVAYGSSVTVNWSSTNAAECSLYDNAGYVISGGTPQRSDFSGNFSSGSITTTSSNTYLYGCSNATGSTGWKTANITVCAPGQVVANGACATPQAVAAPTANIKASSAVVPFGESAVVSWTSSGATECSLYDNAGYIIKGGAAERSGFSGNFSSGSLTAISSNTYQYGCSNGSGSTGWKSVSITVCDQNQTVVNGLCVTPQTAKAASAVDPTFTYTDWYFPNPGSGYDSFAWDVTVNTDPYPNSYFYALQFGFLNDPSSMGGGYFGIQTQGSDPKGKIAIFSLWDSLDANGPEFSGLFTNEGYGRSVRISYPWIAGRTYRLRIAKQSADANGQWWGAWIKDAVTQEEKYVGQIKVAPTLTKLLNAPISWTEYYGPTPSACSGFALSDVSFENMTANGGALRPTSHSNHLSNPVRCGGSYVVDTQYGTRQQIGSTQTPPAYVAPAVPDFEFESGPGAGWSANQQPAARSVPIAAASSDANASTAAPDSSSGGVDSKPVPDTCINIKNNLRYRTDDAQTNGEVSLLQGFLHDKNYLASEPTGYFGRLTLTAVVMFQKDSGFTPTGFVGPLTRAEIKAQTCVVSSASANVAAASALLPREPVPALVGAVNNLLKSQRRHAFETDLHRGMSGSEVQALQETLAAEGYFTGESTGHFYDVTREAVMAFQRKHNIPATGYVGPATRAALNGLK